MNSLCFCVYANCTLSFSCESLRINLPQLCIENFVAIKYVRNNAFVWTSVWCMWVNVCGAKVVEMSCCMCNPTLCWKSCSDFPTYNTQLVILSTRRLPSFRTYFLLLLIFFFYKQICWRSFKIILGSLAIKFITHLFTWISLWHVHKGYWSMDSHCDC